MSRDIDMNKILCEVSEKGKSVVNRCILNGYEVEPFKLQYLLIIMHGTMLAMYDKPFFRQNVYANEKRVFIDEISRDFLKYATRCDEMLKERLFLTKDEEKVVREILEKYGNVSLNELINLRELKILSEVCYDKETDKSVVVPNELIKQVFLYYTFYEYISPRQNEKTFTRSLKKEYSSKKIDNH